MRLYPYYILLAIAFSITLFFACTPELDIPVDPDHFVEQTVCPEVDGWCDNKAGKCYRPECGKCNLTDVWVPDCPYVSSSSKGSSSSVSGSSGSSSSSVASSSSSLAINVTGSFEFRNPDYDSSGSKIYFLKTDSMFASSTVSTSKLLNSLVITGSTCTPITIEVTGTAGLTTMPTSNPSTSPVTKDGGIRATAVTTCNGEKIILKTDSATVVPDPTFSDECILPSYYVYKNETVKDLVTVEDIYGRCKASGITYSPSTYPSSVSTTAQNFSTTASCGPATKTCSWTSKIIVASNYVEFLKKDTHYKVSSGSTVIQMPITDPLQNRLGCEYANPPGGTANIVFKLTVNGFEVNQNGNQNWWVNSFKFEPTYTTNGNRILFETQNNGLECATTHE